MIAILAAAELRAGSAAHFAAQIGVSPQYLSQIKNGAKPPSDRVLDALNLRATTVYHFKESTDAETQKA